MIYRRCVVADMDLADLLLHQHSTMIADRENRMPKTESKRWPVAARPFEKQDQTLSEGREHLAVRKAMAAALRARTSELSARTIPRPSKLSTYGDTATARRRDRYYPECRM
jgi:hypothetical protein